MKVLNSSKGLEDTSSIRVILGPLLRILPFFGLNRFKKTNKNLLILLPLCLLVSSSWSLQGARSVWCLAGAPKPISKSNMAVYMVSLMYSVGCNIFLILGTFYVPKKMNRVLMICDELNSCRQFDNFYKKGLKKKVKYFTTVVSIFAVLFPVIMVFLCPPFVEDYACLQSPYTYSSFQHWMHITSNILNAMSFWGLHMVIHGLVYTFATILSEEFKECNRKLRGLHLQLFQTDLTTNKIRKRYFDVCRLCETIDDLLVPFVAVLLATSFPSVCFFIHTFLYGNVEILLILVFGLLFLINALEMIFIMKQGVMLHGSSKLCIESTKVIDAGRLAQGKDITTLILFIENMRCSDVGITFLKLFTIDRTTIVTVFASLLSYLIVILQFKPSNE